MFKYLIKRIVLLLLVLFLIFFISYFIIYIADINPYIKSAKNKEEAEYLYNLSDLNRPFLVRFFDWFSNIFKFRFGKVYSSEFQLTNTNDVAKLFFGSFTYSLAISIPAFIVGLALGIALGSYAGLKANKWEDYTINTLIYIFAALPIFVLAPLSIIMSSYLNIPTTFLPISISNNIWKTLLSSLLPFILLSLNSFSLFAYYSREEIIQLNKSEYILFLRSLGLSSKQIYFKNMLRNIWIPILKQATTIFLILLSGSLIVQSFFKFPGSAELLEKAFQNGEINILMFNIFFYSIISLVLNFLTDILIVFINPNANYIGEKNNLFFTKMISCFFKRNKYLYQKNNKV